MKYIIYIYKKEGQADISEYVGSTSDPVEARSACILISIALRHLDATNITEVRAVDENFECVYRGEVKAEKKEWEEEE